MAYSHVKEVNAACKIGQAAAWTDIRWLQIVYKGKKLQHRSPKDMSEAAYKQCITNTFFIQQGAPTFILLKCVQFFKDQI